MKTAVRITLLATALTPLLAGCGSYVYRPPTPTNIEAANFTDTRPTAIRITVVGRTGQVLQADTKVPLVLERDGKPKVIGLDFVNGALEVYELPPGHYDIALIGPLVCNGMEFAIDPDAGAVALGSIEVNIFKVNQNTALLSGHAATGAEIAKVASYLQAPSGSISTEPVAIGKSALCSTNYLGQERWVENEVLSFGGDPVTPSLLLFLLF